jgi:hypothetical protein
MLSFHPFFNFKAYTKYGGIYLNLPFQKVSSTVGAKNELLHFSFEKLYFKSKTK